MTLQSQIAFNHGSVNRDSTLQYVRTDQGQVVNRVNLRVNSKDRNKKVNEKIIGNLLVSTILPSGINRQIGWCNDYKNNSLIYFIYNSQNRHSIYRYFLNTKVNQRIFFNEPSLQFENKLIRACVVEDILYWINGEQQPKSFTITWAVNYTNGLVGDAYSLMDEPFEDVVFPLIKRPPRYAPTCSYDSDDSLNFNNLRKHQFQFKYCYEYKDHQRSAWSAISKVPLPSNEISGTGQWVDDIYKNNLINIWVNTGSNQVAKILVAARDCFPNNTGSFYLFETIDKEELLLVNDTPYQIKFYNNKFTESIDTDINNRYCDHVPLSGKDILLMDNKYLDIAYPLVDYDSIIPDYDLTAVESAKIEVDTSSIPMHTDCEFKKIHFGAWETVKTIYIPTDFKPNAIYHISFTWMGMLYSHSIVTGAIKTAGYPTDMRNSFLNDIRAFLGDPDFADNVDGGDHNGIQFEVPVSCAVIENLEGTVTYTGGESIPALKTLKRGQYHPFGIIYNDGFGRYEIVFANNELYSPLVGSGVDDKYKTVSCHWEINHLPPDWAVTYRWCYLRNKTYTYFIYVPHVQCTLGTGTGVGDNGVPVGKLFMRINQAIQNIRDLYQNWQIADYEFANGDRVRSIGSQKSYEILSEWTIVAPDENSEDELGFLIDTDIRDNGNFIRLLEVYRPNPAPQSDKVYLEIGEEFAIENGFHKGETQDQTALLPATGDFDFGDVYFRFRFGDDGIVQPIEDAWYSDYYSSGSIDVGRAGVKIDTKQKYLNRVVRSENFLENTEYNLLNVWMADADYFDASDIWGKIIGIREVGDVLKIIQEHKETSVYIGQIIAKEGDGSNIVLDSSKVFGTENKYIEIRGSQYPNSIQSNKRYLYYFDDSTGEFVRSAVNGQAAISSMYNMKSWFENKAKELREYIGYKDVIVACDNDYNEVLISFIIGKDIETWVFSEEEQENMWMYYVTYKTDTKIPENFAFHGDTLFSFMDGKLYIHNQGANNTFYGQLHPCYIEFVINLPAYVSKKFDNIRINSDRNIWDVEFNINAMHNYTAQKSILKPTIIKEKDGIIQSDILKNILNRAGTTDLQLLYKGQDLAGEILQVKLSNNDNYDVILGEVEVKFQINK